MSNSHLLVEKCERCKVVDEDRRTLKMSCFYDMSELDVPFNLDEDTGTYNLRVCKDCRSDWMKAIEYWFHNSSFKKQNPSPNQTNEITQLNPPVSNSNLSKQSSNCIANNNSDDEVNSPNMTNYNYYSSIINNLRTDENTNQEATANSKLNESNSNSNMKFKANSFSNISKKFKIN